MAIESILTSVKKLSGITVEYEHFDEDLTMFINTVFMTLNQLGVGPKECFHITDETETWNDFLGDRTDLEAVKTYMYLKARHDFDPPQSSAHLSAMERSIAELEWRLNVAAESADSTETDG